MDLAKSCEEGQIGIERFCCELLTMRSRRTHFLREGKCYVVSPRFGRSDVVALDKVVKLDSPEKGDFETESGAIGPINGNVFVAFQKGEYPECLLVEGDRIGEPNCPVPVYDLVNDYTRRRCKLN